MEKKKVNELAFFNYLEKCKADKASIGNKVIEVLTPALESLGVTSAEKVSAIVEPIIAEKTTDISETIAFLESFVETVIVEETVAVETF